MTTRSASPCTVLTDGCHLVVDALKANDVDTIYGVVGIPITDLARAAQASGIRYIGFRHEASAGNAAAAAGFLTARPGVCLTTSGPGFLNGLPALANATTNCFPMIQISGSSSRPMVDLQRGDYQDLDQLNAARPFVKAAYRIGQVQDIGRGVARAIRTATSGRPGGVYLDIPGDVLGQAVEASAASGAIWRPVDPAPRLLPAPEAIFRSAAPVWRHDPAPTVLNAHARHELIAEAFGGKGYHVSTPTELESALTDALASNGPSLIDCELDPADGVESGHLAKLNTTSAATPAISGDG